MFTPKTDQKSYTSHNDHAVCVHVYTVYYVKNTDFHLRIRAETRNARVNVFIPKADKILYVYTPVTYTCICAHVRCIRTVYIHVPV